MDDDGDHAVSGVSGVPSHGVSPGGAVTTSVARDMGLMMAPEILPEARARDFWTAFRPGAGARYWEDHQATHRDTLIEALTMCVPFDSVLEVGAHAGPNLRRIHDAWPQVRLYATDVNADALAYGAAQAQAEGWEFRRLAGRTEDLVPQLPGDEADVVLSCYHLCYVRPDAISGVLDHLLRIARKAVVLAEPMVTRGTPPAGLVTGISLPEWRHDYVALLQRLAPWAATCHIVRLEPPVQRLTGVLVLRLDGAA